MSMELEIKGMVCEGVMFVLICHFYISRLHSPGRRRVFFLQNKKNAANNNSALLC